MRREALAAEVAAAMRRGVRLMLAHETPGFGQEGRRAIEFAHFFSVEQTPSELVAAGIYSTLAVPLKGHEWRPTSLALLARSVEGGHVASSFEARMARVGMARVGMGRLARFASSMRQLSRGASRARISIDGSGGDGEGHGSRRGRPQLSERDNAKLIEMASARRSGGADVEARLSDRL